MGDAPVFARGMLAGASLAPQGTSAAGAPAHPFLTTSTRRKVELDLTETLVVGVGMIALFTPIPQSAMYPDLSVPIVGVAWLGVLVGMVLFVNVHRRRRRRKASREWGWTAIALGCPEGVGLVRDPRRRYPVCGRSRRGAVGECLAANVSTR